MHNFISYLAQFDTSPLPNGAVDSSKLSTVITTVLVITGSISVLMVVIGGIRYIISRGEPQGITQAKDTILYALVGLFITMSAAAIVKFVLKGF